MTTIIGLFMALYFGPTQEQIQYCNESAWSQEVIEVNGRYTLPEEVRGKARICEKLLNNNINYYE